ncbi:sensor histidine kinase [Parvularcula sp. LCG005]|uniref:sensor histidine kinase n=1 Tax=Parvularcula sp. LCG005 TaxID=3078805 RepID=UPI0029428C1B|nr:sensor histidine kinase [Parvularcula sp. LCG005]WOI52903.1 sensor histidine kinase [Parvularcula sp. LCG005]
MFVRSLRERLLVTIAAALSPILVFAGFSAIQDARNGVNDRRNDLVLLASDAIGRMEQSLATTEILQEAFAPEFTPENCAEVAARVNPLLPYVGNVGRFDVNGDYLCTSLSNPEGLSTRNTWLQQLKDGAEVVRTEAFFGKLSETWVFAVIRRLTDEQGEFDGGILFSVRVRDLLNTAAFVEPAAGVEVALADDTGKLFGSSRFAGIDPGLVSQARQKPAFMVVESRDGVRYDVVVSLLGADGVYAVLSRVSPGPLSEFTLRPVSAVGLPLLIFVSALVVAWLAVDRFVLQWLRPLRQLAMVYGEGHYEHDVDASFQRAPQEIASFARTFGRMAARIRERDTALIDAIEKRDAAVKEIHHRIKNNLQIVTSFVSLQSRAVKDTEAREVLAAVRHRIDALSIVHQTLYHYESLETVQMGAFFDALLEHLGEALGMDELGVELDWDIEDIEINADDAIPMALFVLEAVTNSIKYAFDEDGGELRVELRRQDGNVELAVIDDGCGEGGSNNSQVSGSGLGTKLMNAFAKQVRGTVAVTAPEEGGYRVVLTLPYRLRSDE